MVNFVFGLHFPFGSSGGKLEAFPVSHRQGERLPDVHVLQKFQLFGTPLTPIIRRVKVTIGSDQLVVYGYRLETLPPNESLADIPSSIPWPGEIAVFSVGKRVPFLSNPRAIKKKNINLAIALFISRIMEALDTGNAPSACVTSPYPL